MQVKIKGLIIKFTVAILSVIPEHVFWRAGTHYDVIISHSANIKATLFVLDENNAIR